MEKRSKQERLRDLVASKHNYHFCDYCDSFTQDMKSLAQEYFKNELKVSFIVKGYCEDCNRLKFTNVRTAKE